MIDGEFDAPVRTQQPLCTGVVRGGVVRLVEHIEHACSHPRPRRGLPGQRQVGGAVARQLQRVGVVGVALADVARAAGQGPVGQELPAQPHVGQAFGHIRRHIAVARDQHRRRPRGFQEVLELGLQHRRVGIERPLRREVPVQRSLDATRSLRADLHAAVRLQRVAAEQTGLADAVGGQRPLATVEGLLHAHLELPALGQVERPVGRADHQQAADRVRCLRILRVQVQRRAQRKHRARAPPGAAVGLREHTLAAYQIGAIDAGTIVAQPAQHRPALTQCQPVFHEQRVLLGAVAVARQVRRIADARAGPRMERIDRARTAGIGVVGVLEVRTVGIQSHRETVRQAAHLTLHAQRRGQPGLVLVVGDPGASALRQSRWLLIW
ncbi:hypothetical protein G6F65_010818 [Rhizopus arrhizus]|nr:hypothetical protein G6F65_010818 [Rhizopus arrhizus]